MITSIVNVNAIKGSGRITFDVISDATGASENGSTLLEGQTFTTRLDLGPGASPDQAIQHTKSGLHTVTVHADASHVSSNPVLLDL